MTTIVLIVVGAFGLLSGLVALVLRRRRQVRLGLLLALVALPGALLSSGGQVPRGRAMLIVTPVGSEATLERFLGQIPPETVVSIVRLAPPNLSGETPSPSPRWRRARTVRADELSEAPVVGLSEGWLSRIAALGWPGPLSRILKRWPKPTIVLLHDQSDFWKSAETASVSVSRDAVSIDRVGADLVVVDVSEGALASGWLEVELSRSRLIARESDGGLVLEHDSTDALVRLHHCRHFPRDRKYTIRAWVNPVASTGEAFAALGAKDTIRPSREATSGASDRIFVLEGLGPEEVRRTRVPLASLVPSAEKKLRPGLHECHVELEFEIDLGSTVVPLRYHESVYFEVVSPKVVLFDGSPEFGLTRSTWVHRRTGAKLISPPSPGRLLFELGKPVQVFRSGNGSRMPYASVWPFNIGDVVEKVDDVKHALKGAATLVLFEPTWNDVVRIEKDLGVEDRVRDGLSLIVVGAPIVPPGVAPPTWIIAKAKTAPAAENHALYAYDEPRLYFLPDASRPGSQFRTERGAKTGADLQREVINAIYSHYDVVDRYNTKLADVVEIEGGDLSMGSGYTVAVGKLPELPSTRRRDLLVVPPLMVRPKTTRETVSGRYQNSQGEFSDLAGCWVEMRLRVLARTSARESLHTSALAKLVAVPPQFETETPERMDLPIRLPHRHDGSVVVVFAVNVRQPSVAVSPDSLEWNVWSEATSKSKLPQFGVLPAKDLVDSGARVLIVPIEIASEYTDYYETALFGADGVLLSQAAENWGAEVLEKSIDLTQGDGEASKSTDDVIEALEEKLDSMYASAPVVPTLSITDRGRAVDVRVEGGPVVRVRQDIVPLDSSIRPAVQFEYPASAKQDSRPAILWKPIGLGSVHALAYSPLAEDRLSRDRGTFQYEETLVSGERAYDGWGLQRLIDPLVLRSGGLSVGLQITSVTIAPDRSRVFVDCTVPPESAAVSVPQLDPPDSGLLDLAVAGTRMRLTIAATDAPLEGLYSLRFGDGTTCPIFLNLRPREEGGESLARSLERVAVLSGGAFIHESVVSTVVSTPLLLTWLGGVLLPLFVFLALSPLVRRWAPVGFRFGTRTSRRERQAQIDDDIADVEAAINQGGMNAGAPTPQRPAGPIMQLRPIRPGDSPLAALKTDWGYFAEDIEKILGSPILPRVYETPKQEAISVVTILDLHSGALVHDDGSYQDRQRAMGRLAALSAATANRRGGSHRIAALQVKQDLDATTCDDPEDAAPALTELVAKRGRQVHIPDLLTNEVVIFITDPASRADEIMDQLCARCGEARASLVLVLITDPRQLDETGLARPRGTPWLLDRNDLDREDIEHFHWDRSELLGSRATLAEGIAVNLRSDLSASRVAMILGEMVWSQL